MHPKSITAGSAIGTPKGAADLIAVVQRAAGLLALGQHLSTGAQPPRETADHSALWYVTSGVYTSTMYG